MSGVYTVSIDSDQGKVTVSGSADPSLLIKKLNKAGKHAELLSPKGGSTNNKNNKKNNNFLLISDQLEKPELHGSRKGQQKDNGKPPKSDGGAGAKDQNGQQLSQLMFKDLKLPQLKGLNFPSPKDQKNVKFSLPEGSNGGSDLYDDYDDDDDDFDDYDDDDDFDDLDDEDDFDDDLKLMNTKPMSIKKGGGNNRGDDDRKSGGSNGGKKGSGDKLKDNAKNSKKGGEKNEAQPKMISQGFSEMDVGKMNSPMGSGGIPQGMPAPNSYQQQQMMMNGPRVYGQPMGYMPVPLVYGEPYANYFSDENTSSSCSIM